MVKSGAHIHVYDIDNCSFTILKQSLPLNVLCVKYFWAVTMQVDEINNKTL